MAEQLGDSIAARIAAQKGWGDEEAIPVSDGAASRSSPGSDLKQEHDDTHAPAAPTGPKQPMFGTVGSQLLSHPAEVAKEFAKDFGQGFTEEFQPVASFARTAFVEPAQTLVNLATNQGKRFGAPGAAAARAVNTVGQALTPETSTPMSKIGALAGYGEGLAAKGGVKGAELLSKAPQVAKMLAKAPKVARVAIPAAQGALAAALQTPSGKPGDMALNSLLGAGLSAAGVTVAPKTLAALQRVVSKAADPVANALSRAIKEQPGEVQHALDQMRAAATAGVRTPAFIAHAPEAVETELKRSMERTGGGPFRQTIEQKLAQTSREANQFIDDTLAKSKTTGEQLINSMERAKSKLASRMFPEAYAEKIKDPAPQMRTALASDLAPSQIDKAIKHVRRGPDSAHEQAVLPALRKMKEAATLLNHAEREGGDAAKAMRKQADAKLKNLPAGAYHMLAKYAGLRVGDEVTMDSGIFKDIQAAAQDTANQAPKMRAANKTFSDMSGKIDAVAQGAKWFTGDKTAEGTKILRAPSDVAADFKAMTPAQQKLAKESWIKNAVQFFSGESGKTASEMQKMLTSAHFQDTAKAILGPKDARALTGFMDAMAKQHEGLERVAKTTEQLKKKTLVDASGWLSDLVHLASPIGLKYHGLRLGTRLAQDLADEGGKFSAAGKRAFQRALTSATPDEMATLLRDARKLAPGGKEGFMGYRQSPIGRKAASDIRRVVTQRQLPAKVSAALAGSRARQKEIDNGSETGAGGGR